MIGGFTVSEAVRVVLL
jgi:hypothetical protein